MKFIFKNGRVTLGNCTQKFDGPCHKTQHSEENVVSILNEKNYSDLLHIMQTYQLY